MPQRRTQIENRIKTDQLASLVALTPVTLASNTFVSMAFAGMLYRCIDTTILAGWLLSNLALNAARLLAVRVARSSKYVEYNPQVLLDVFGIGALMSGLLWTVLLYICHLYGQAYNLAVGMTFCGINAGAIIQNPATRFPALAFVLPSNLALMVLFVADPSLEMNTMAVTLFLLTILMIKSCDKSERNFITSARLKHEATHLAESLQRANVSATQALQLADHAANYDYLTDLANRAAYQRAFEDRLARAERAEGVLSVILIDLDGFKPINDTYGHAAGDAILIEVAHRLRAILTPEDVIARLGGDEFAALIFRSRIDEAEAPVPERIIAAIAAPFALSEQTVHVGASVGVSHFPRDGRTVERLQTCADIALYAAKSDGRGRWRDFREGMGHEGAAKHALVDDLIAALDDHTIEVWFQPQIDCTTGRVSGLEALLRWKHPRLGWVPPPDVVEAATGSGLSQRLTRHVLRQACRMVQQLDACGHGEITVSINLSPDEFGTYAVADMVAAELAAHRLDGHRIAIEITEEAAYSAERGGADVTALRALGVRVIIDDFGVGFSSMCTLRTIACDVIKIDRSFVQGLAGQGVTGAGQDRMLVGAMVAFARSLGVGIVAEGVETAEHVEILKDLGCRVLQGYHYAPALPPVRALAWITKTALDARTAPRAGQIPDTLDAQAALVKAA